MLLELHQSLNLSQQLVITQEMQQAIKLLQLNHQELVTEIQAEMVENPALEEIPGTSPDHDFASDVVANPDKDDPVADGGDKIDWERFLDGYSSNAAGSGSSGGFDELPPIEANLVRSPTLYEHLSWQLQMQSCTDDELKAAKAIIHNLDHRGYLTVTLEHISEKAEVSLDAVEGAHEIILELDPLGCGARNLRECLKLQAKILHPEDPILPQIIDRHLENLERRSYSAIARDLKIETEDAVEYHKMMQDLEPIPGREFSDSGNQYITPDIKVFKIGDEWFIQQNEDGLPKLRVSPYYARMLKDQQGSKGDRTYVKDKLQSAAFLIQAIHRRQRTIHKVVKSILEKQQDFFEHGIDHLRPMILKDVANDIGVHESTVSRATTHKYVQCPQGIFELKFFFNAAIKRVGGGDVASEMVKNRIKQLISKEDPLAPLSDQALVVLLKSEGLKVARRTVAKYRDEQGILPSSKRKKMF